MINAAMFSSNTAEWATPQTFFDELNKEFNFTLDPCATPQNAKCKRYFTKEINGLAQSWQGEIVFCNPPYGRDLKNWVEKAYNETKTAGGGNGGCPTYTRPNRHSIFSRFYIPKTRNTFYSRTITLQRKQIGSTLPLNGGCNAFAKRGG